MSFPNFYDPSFIPKDLDINNFVQQESYEKSKVVEKVNKKISDIDFDKNLSYEESLVVDEYMQSLKEQIATTKDKIALLKTTITEQALVDQEFTIDFNAKAKPSVQRAIKRVFGSKQETITYSMYLQALEAKNRLEKQDAEEYLS